MEYECRPVATLTGSLTTRICHFEIRFADEKKVGE